MRGAILTVLCILGALAVFGVFVYAEALVWSECRETHSWLYCVRVLG